MVALADSKSDGCAGTRVLQAYINTDIGKAKLEELLDSGEKLGGYAEPNGDQHALPLGKLVSPPFKMAVPPRAASAVASSSSSSSAAAAAAVSSSPPPRKARWHLPSGVLQTAKALVVHDKRLFPADALL